MTEPALRIIRAALYNYLVDGPTTGCDVLGFEPSVIMIWVAKWYRDRGLAELIDIEDHTYRSAKVREMIEHKHQAGRSLEQIARECGFRGPESPAIWWDPMDETLKESGRD